MPSSRHSGKPSKRALRSHSETSTAAIAIDVIPGLPRLRVARTIPAHAVGGFIGSAPRTTAASFV